MKAACARKRRWRLQWRAQRAFRRFHGDHPRFNVYRCPHGRHYHIGHTPGVNS